MQVTNMGTEPESGYIFGSGFEFLGKTGFGAGFSMMVWCV